MTIGKAHDKDTNGRKGTRTVVNGLDRPRLGVVDFNRCGSFEVSWLCCEVNIHPMYSG